MFGLSFAQLLIIFLILCMVAVACLIIGMFIERNNPTLLSNLFLSVTQTEANVKTAILTTETNLTAKVSGLETNIKSYVDSVVAAIKKV